MPKFIPVLFAVAMISPLMAETAAEKSQAFYQAGLAAEKAGDPAAARKAYQEALTANPKNANAQYQLGQINIHGEAIAAKGRENKIGAVMIPSYQLDGASVQEAFELLGSSISKESKSQIAPNFIIQDPAGKLADKKLSFQLKNIPAKGVIDYILTQANAKARYEEHAVVILPR